MKPRRELSLDERKARAVEARALLANPTLLSALDELQDMKVQELMSCGVGTSQAHTAHAILRSLGELLSVLEIYRDAALDTKTRKM